MKILVTGTAGFIGYYLARRLLERGDEVVGVDSINDYYDVLLKHARLTEAGIEGPFEYGVPVSSSKYSAYSFMKVNLEDREAMESLFRQHSFDAVCNLAAQAGVRYSLQNPHAYIDANIIGFMNVLECCRHYGTGHLVYASSSSVYGLNSKIPFSVEDCVDRPASLYAATKKANELMAHTYSHLYAVPATGLRFFTVYGPWGRPDMACFLFVKAIAEGRKIDLYNYGDMKRDFTYIDDIIEGVVRVIDSPPGSEASNDGKTSQDHSAPYRIYNIGNNSPVKLLDFVSAIEKAMGRKAEVNLMPMQPGDVYATYADVSPLERDFGYRPSTRIEDGVEKFVNWYISYYKN